MKCQIFAILAAITVALLPVAAPASAEPQKGDAPGIVNFSEIRGDRGFAGSSLHSLQFSDACRALWMIGRVIKDGWDIDAARREAESIALKPGEAIAFATWYVTSRARAKPDR